LPDTHIVWVIMTAEGLTRRMRPLLGIIKVGNPGWKGDETHFHHVQSFSKKPIFDAVDDYRSRGSRFSIIYRIFGIKTSDIFSPDKSLIIGYSQILNLGYRRGPYFQATVRPCLRIYTMIYTSANVHTAVDLLSKCIHIFTVPCPLFNFLVGLFM
jgi:hypothetical protein